MLSPHSSALRYHLLVIDGTQADLRHLHEILSTHHFHLSVVSDPVLIYQTVLQNVPDMILLDVAMAGVDSAETIRQLRKNSVTHHIPVLLLTSMENIDDCLKGLRIGASDYIAKPYSAPSVLQRIRAHLPSLPRQSLGFPAHFSESDARPGSKEQRVLVETVKEYLLSRLTNPPKLADLVHRFSVSERRLSLAFRECEGQTVFEYIRQRRMEMAKKLLTESTLSIELIAKEIGFSSAANFSTAFYSFEGLSPSAYRRRAYYRAAAPERKSDGGTPDADAIALSDWLN